MEPLRSILKGTSCVQGETADLVPFLAAHVYSLFYDTLSFVSLAARWEALGVSSGAIQCVEAVFLRGA